MEKIMSKFKDLLSVNVNEKTEKKGQFTYLSWAFAWAEFKKAYPDATYKIFSDENNNPYTKSECGYMCYTEVTADGLTYQMWLPVMNYKNQAMDNPTVMDINKTIMRCLVKNLAMFGLGLYIYAGEDLPEEQLPKLRYKNNEIAQNAVKQWKENGVPFIDVVQRLNGKYEISDSDYELLNEFYCSVSDKVKTEFRFIFSSNNPNEMYLFQQKFSPEQWGVLVNSFANDKTANKAKLREMVNKGREVFNKIVDEYKLHMQNNDELGMKELEEQLPSGGIELLNRRLKAVK
jgi:hypothetical protein